MARHVAALSALLVLLTALPVRSLGHRDGGWWGSQADAEKLAFVNGLLDGGTIFAVDVLAASAARGIVPGNAALPSGGYLNLTRRLTDGVRPRAVVSGMDLFYDDPSNRNVPPATAAFLVLSRSAGMMDEDTLEMFTEHARRN